MTPALPPPHSFRQGTVNFLIVCALVFPLVLTLGMTKNFSHDEHQHVAAGALVAREGLMPYRDFPHFHTPYLAYIYALLFRCTDHLLLAARLFTVACATALVGLLGSVAYGLFRDQGRRFAALVSTGTVLLFLTARVFGETTGRAWNHEPALLFSLLAFLAHARGIAMQKGGWLIGSGILLGIAIGLRITFAPLVAPFFLALALYSPPPRWRPRLFASFAGGLFVGGFGILCLFIAAPEQAWFGNYEFAKVNVLYRFENGNPRTMTFLKKLRYFKKEFLRRELLLVIAGVLPMIAMRLTRTLRHGARFEHGFVLISLPFLLIGCFAPSPLFQQYFYPLVPFLLLAGLYGLASVAPETVWFRRTLVLGALCAVLSVGLGRRIYDHIGLLASARSWTPVKFHRFGVELRQQAASGRMLTLAPIYPLEAGLPIYPALATGPFAWRISPYVEAGKAARLGMVTPATLEATLDADPPAAFLLGIERSGGHEHELQNYAGSRGYVPAVRADGHELWTKKAGERPAGMPAAGIGRTED